MLLGEFDNLDGMLDALRSKRDRHLDEDALAVLCSLTSSIQKHCAAIDERRGHCTIAADCKAVEMSIMALWP